MARDGLACWLHGHTLAADVGGPRPLGLQGWATVAMLKGQVPPNARGGIAMVAWTMPCIVLVLRSLGLAWGGLCVRKGSLVGGPALDERHRPVRVEGDLWEICRTSGPDP